MIRRRAARLHDESGYSLVELLIVLIITGVIMGSLTTLFVQASNAEVTMNARFRAQQDARVALDKMRRDLHCASGATTATATTLTVNNACVAGGKLTWCAQTLNSRTQLFRNVGTTCPTTAPRYADWLLSGKTYFTYQGSSTTSLALVYVCLPVNPKPGSTGTTYSLQGQVVFRNSTRVGSAAAVAQPACPG